MHKNTAAFLLYWILVSIWAATLYLTSNFDLVVEYWPILPTMLLGSLIAGTTPAGGGAVAFPVLTLVFSLHPSVARDFSVMIQSVGMSAAALSIIIARAEVDWKLVRIGLSSSLPGIVLGMYVIAPRLPPTQTKVFFVSLWLAFGMVLFLTSKNTQSVTQLPKLKTVSLTCLILGGIFGGIITGITGSGLDIALFSVAALSFSLHEGVATRSSIIMMAVASLITFGLRGASASISPETFNYWLVAIPAVLFGAPFGALVSRKKSRHFTILILSAAVSIQFIGACCILPMTRPLVLLSTATLLGGIAFFLTLRYFNRTGYGTGSGSA